MKRTFQPHNTRKNELTVFVQRWEAKQDEKCWLEDGQKDVGV